MYGHDYLDDLTLGKQTISLRHSKCDVDVIHIDNSGRYQVVLAKVNSSFAILYYNGAEETFKYLLDPDEEYDEFDAYAELYEDDCSDDYDSWKTLCRQYFGGKSKE